MNKAISLESTEMDNLRSPLLNSLALIYPLPVTSNSLKTLNKQQTYIPECVKSIKVISKTECLLRVLKLSVLIDVVLQALHNFILFSLFAWGGSPFQRCLVSCGKCGRTAVDAFLHWGMEDF